MRLDPFSRIYHRLFCYHLAQVDAGVLYRCGNRGSREFARNVKACSAKLVVSLVDDAEMAVAPFSDEPALLQKQGSSLHRIIIPLGGWPTSDQIQHFLSLCERAKTDPSAGPVLVHCAQGVRRTGMLVAAYQMSVLGWDAPTTKAAMLTFGHSRRTVGDLEKFVDAYDAKSRQLTRTFTRSKE